MNSDVNKLNIGIQNRTPGKDFNLYRTSSKTPSKSIPKTPSHGNICIRPKTPKTPTAGDRFIPNRTKSNPDLAFKSILKSHGKSGSKDENKKTSYYLNGKNMDKSKNDLTTDLMSQLYLGESFSDTSRMFNYSQGPNNKSVNEEMNRILHPLNLTKSFIDGNSLNQSVQKSQRVIATKPEKILDAPDIINDYYLNLLDWSSRNILAIALCQSVYLWDGNNGDTTHLMDCPIDVAAQDENSTTDATYVSSLSWMDNGKFLAIGLSESKIQVWDVTTIKMVRTMKVPHKRRISSLSWNSHLLSSGSQSGHIFHHDARIKNHLISQSKHHKLEVCGLKWSPNGRLLASGGNDNSLCIWELGLINPDNKASKTGGSDCSDMFSIATNKPLFVFDKQHTSAVKALAWCPWKSNFLASGGGAIDRKICLWNAQGGTLVKSIDTGSQVCSLVWGKLHKELISSHGGPDQNIVALWKYPAMNKFAQLNGHSDRVLFTALSPDGTTLASAGADEVINIWKYDAPSQPTTDTFLENRENLLYMGSKMASSAAATTLQPPTFGDNMDAIR